LSDIKILKEPFELPHWACVSSPKIIQFTSSFSTMVAYKPSKIYKGDFSVKTSTSLKRMD
jgi:hypothetical protein